MPDPLTFSRIIGLLVIAYLSGLLIVAHRLKSSHRELWESLGSFSFLNWGILNGMRLFCFVFLSGEHRRLGDSYLSNLVYSLRFLVLLMIAMIAVWTAYYGGHR